MFFTDIQNLLNHKVDEGEDSPSDVRKAQRKLFSKEEDEMLLRLVEKYGTEKNWNEISKHMSGRTAKQCKGRYFSVLCPGINKKPFTEEEDDLLLQKVAMMGKRWASIAIFFEGRTPNSLKNRWMFKQKQKIDAITFLSSKIHVINFVKKVNPAFIADTSNIVKFY